MSYSFENAISSFDVQLNLIIKLKISMVKTVLIRNKKIKLKLWINERFSDLFSLQILIYFYKKDMCLYFSFKCSKSNYFKFISNR